MQLGKLKLTISALSIGWMSLTLAGNNAQPIPWQGEWYNIMPNRAGVTEAYCITHSLDTYQTTQALVNQDVKAKNGITAVNTGYVNKVIDGLYFHQGTALLSGTDQGKPWKTKVHYYVQSLTADGPTQGVWSTKDCKGFVKAGPAVLAK